MCRDCGADPTCVLCVECFQHSIHRQHKYRVSKDSPKYQNPQIPYTWKAKYSRWYWSRNPLHIQNLCSISESTMEISKSKLRRINFCHSASISYWQWSLTFSMKYFNVHSVDFIYTVYFLDFDVQTEWVINRCVCYGYSVDIARCLSAMTDSIV